MKVEYCSECGNKNLYEVSKPKFCSKCGEPLSAFASKDPPQLRQDNHPTDMEIDDPDGEDIFHVPSIGSLQYEVSHDQSKRTTLGHLANSENPGQPEKLRRSRNIKEKSKQSENKWDVIKKTMKECSSNSEPTDIE